MAGQLRVIRNFTMQSDALIITRDTPQSLRRGVSWDTITLAKVVLNFYGTLCSLLGTFLTEPYKI